MREGSLHRAESLLQICGCGPAFSFASPKENAGKRKRARRDCEFPPGAPLKRPEKPLWFFWTFPAQTDRYAHSQSLPLRGRWLGEAETDEGWGALSILLCRYSMLTDPHQSALRAASFPQGKPTLADAGGPCLSLWERWLSEAKTERVNAAMPSQSPPVTALPEGEPRGFPCLGEIAQISAGYESAYSIMLFVCSSRYWRV